MNMLPQATGAGPRAEYSRRLDFQRIQLVGIEKQHRNLGYAKLGLGALTLFVLGLAALAKAISIFWIFFPPAAILVLSAIHDRVLMRRERSTRTVSYYERSIARLENRWMGNGDSGARFQNDAHPYSRDLDLFGPGSMFELLCAARTRKGQETLAQWLREPASPEVVRARQAAVDDLRTRLDLRQDLAVLAQDARSLAPGEALAAWCEGEPLLSSRTLQLVCALLALAWLACLVGWLFWDAGYYVLVLSSLNFSLHRAFHRKKDHVVTSVEAAAQDLELLAGVLARLEAEQFAAPRLSDMSASLRSEGKPPSWWIARLHRLMGSLDSRRNPVIRVIDPFAFWTLQCACAIDSWRKCTGHAARSWLAAIGEFEALSSLACYAYEHPTDVFPEFATSSPWFEAEGLAHPLLPDLDAVRNDLHFGQDLRVLIISGPNMAGKSTFVRAVGINTVLAQCGAPVRARRLRLSPLAVGASICVLDSLPGGISRFYAEIRRLKQITDLTEGPTAVLFLLDEFLQGTNSEDRRVGAEAMVRSLVERGAIGLVTTHDLALAKIADGLGAHAANVHFQDRLEDGKLIFDYRLKPGIVESSNALNLMRSIGLEV